MQGRQPPTIGAVAERLQLRHHGTVELIDRLVDRGMLARRPGGQDRREALVELRPPGETILRRLALFSLRELETEGPALVSTLRRLIEGSKGTNGSRPSPRSVGDGGRRPSIVDGGQGRGDRLRISFLLPLALSPPGTRERRIGR